jgi:antitoxin component YwqK of YwqJK toxin-antitoxin module
MSSESVAKYKEFYTFENNVSDILKVEYSIINGKIEGEYKEYDIEGKLLKLYNYVNGKKHGKYESYEYFFDYEDNTTIYEIGEYVNDLPHGTFNTYILNVFKRSNYGNDDDDEYEGKQFIELKKICNYKNGQLDGEYKEYIKYFNDNDNELKISCNYVNGQLDGEYKEYYYYHEYHEYYEEYTAPVQLIKNSCMYVNGEKTEYKEYHYDGSLVASNEIKQLYVSGKLKCEFFIANYKKEGEYKEYYNTENDKHGSLKIICNYINGKKHGEYKEYHYNGSLKMSCYYLYNKKHGETNYYNEDGTLDYTD